MTPEAQRIAIAKACGCRWVCYDREGTGSDKPIYLLTPHELEIKHGGRFVKREDFTGYAQPSCCVPNYLNDLNAMHEAEKVLTESARWMNYNAKLFLVAAGINLSAGVNRPESLWLFQHATAAQRAEAFLRTLGLWRDA